jgi:hypothetical protein
MFPRCTVQVYGSRDYVCFSVDSYLHHYWIRLLCREPGALGKGLKALGKAHGAVEERQS